MARSHLCLGPRRVGCPPFTVILYYSTNLVLYVGLTYLLLSVREKRKRRDQEKLGPMA
jgi:hypothetical protein